MEPRFIASQMRQRGGGAPPAAPTLSGVDPTSGPAESEFTLTGTGLAYNGDNGGTLTFHNDIEGDFNANITGSPADTTMTGALNDSITPAVYDITVTTPNGSDTLPAAFTVTP